MLCAPPMGKCTCLQQKRHCFIGKAPRTCDQLSLGLIPFAQNVISLFFKLFLRYSTISQGSQAISFHSFEVNSICTEGHFSLLCMEDCVLLKKLEQLHTRNYLSLEYEIKSLILFYTIKSCIQNLFKFLEIQKVAII